MRRLTRIRNDEFQSILACVAWRALALKLLKKPLRSSLGLTIKALQK